MSTYCALLRGIAPNNPNMRNERLREVFVGLGFDQVGSVISSGNVVFGLGRVEPLATADLEDRIQAALQTELQIKGGTIIRSRSELAALVERSPFGELEHSNSTYLTVTFLKRPMDPVPDPFPQPADPLVRVIGYDQQARAILAVCDNSTDQAPTLMVWLERNFGSEMTTRTWRTVTRIEKLLAASR